jgi:8-hydroxy-5-deazaflavin:NADPH oxidoreductase
MKVTVFGAGNMARGVGTRLVAGGNDVQVLAPQSDEVEPLVEELSGKARSGATVQGGGPDDPVTGDVVVLAVWYEPATSLVAERGDQLAGKVVVDITNPVDTATFDGLVTPADSSAAEEIARKMPEGVQVVKAFNTTFAGTLVDGEVDGQPLDVFIAGDDEAAKDTVAELVKSGGLRPIDAGSLKRARELEALGFLHMAVQDNLGTGYGSAVRIVS